MIIACPKCSRRFGVQDDLVPASGRRARCASCGEVFIALPTVPQDDDSPIHFEILPNPGDGPATSSSFVAPAAPPAVLAQRRGSGIPMPGLAHGGPPVLAGRGQYQAAHDRTVALSPETLSAIRRSMSSQAPPVVKEPGSPRWIARDELGRPAACDRRDLVRMIRAGLLLPGDHLKEEGTGREALASEIQDLSYYFALRTSLPVRAAGPAPGPVMSPGTSREAGATDSSESISPENAPAAPVPTSVHSGTGVGNGTALSPSIGYGTGLLLVAAAAIAPAALLVLPAGPAPVLPFGVGAASGGCLASALWVVLTSWRRGRQEMPGRSDS